MPGCTTDATFPWTAQRSCGNFLRMEAPATARLNRGDARSVVSQHGEDGLLDKIFAILPGAERSRWCVEFGAWDGKHLSNTWHLIADEGWSAVLIEADRSRYKTLAERFSDNPRVTTINAFVSLDGRHSLDVLLAASPIPRDFDLLSIDIDGIDYHVWDSVRLYQPKVVVIEYNPTIPNDIVFVQPRDPSVSQGSSAAAFVRLAKTKGYELIAATTCNLIFVTSEYFPLFQIDDNSLANLRDWHDHETRIYQLYDGTLVVDGCDQLCWHGIGMKDSIQVLPRMLRKFPGALSLPQRLALRAYKAYLYVRDGWRSRTAS